eukprot:CAMPEP_0173300044 /NCGR_PEP_ID=MMETSP1143-20121109/17014_1 /TAXON_ID=483371 /ORGANISM="non described non described, Strain CCMP2298" /LENGTH=126 /DNA_ID=CAMNT_0014240397 /DNA_START=156 /DNA_END=537 /DNA_ORIENTATION=-
MNVERCSCTLTSPGTPENSTKTPQKSAQKVTIPGESSGRGVVVELAEQEGDEGGIGAYSDYTWAVRAPTHAPTPSASRGTVLLKTLSSCQARPLDSTRSSSSSSKVEPGSTLPKHSTSPAICSTLA